MGVYSQRKLPGEGMLEHGHGSTAKHVRKVTQGREKSLWQAAKIDKRQALSEEHLAGRKVRCL